jgi:hypothetical protein
MRFGTFLKTFDPVMHADYVNETFLEKNNKTPERKETKLEFVQPVFVKTGVLAGLKKISSLEVNHPAKLYVQKRKIPPDRHYKLFYAPRFKEFVNGLIPNKFADVSRDEARLILPFLDEEKRCFGFQGRAIGNSSIRYITIMLRDDKPKIFGLDALDTSKEVIVVEGPIDSLFLPNAIAMAGSDASLVWLPQETHKRVTFAYDNEPRNKDIVKKMQGAAHKGFKVVVWPAELNSKDINDMILSGLTSVEIKKIIAENSYEGLAARLAITNWSKL